MDLDAYVFLSDHETFSPVRNTNLAVAEPKGEDEMVVTTYSIEKMFVLLTPEQRKTAEVECPQDILDELAEAEAFAEDEDSEEGECPDRVAFGTCEHEECKEADAADAEDAE